jgi:hypothetical protein
MNPEQRVTHLEAIAGGASPDTGGLVEIITNRRPLRDVTADGLDALETANVPPVLFARTGAPARVRRDEDHRPFVEQLSEAGMRGALARAANCVSVSDKGSTHVAPPLEVVRDLLALGAWPFPPLRGLIEAATTPRPGSSTPRRCTRRPYRSPTRQRSSSANRHTSCSTRH